MKSTKEYILPVPTDDYSQGLSRTRSLVRRLIRNLLKHIGAVKFKITIDAVMEKEPGTSRKAGFRTTLTLISFENDIENILDSMFVKLENSIESYNKGGFSSASVKEITKVRVLVVKHVV